MVKSLVKQERPGGEKEGRTKHIIPFSLKFEKPTRCPSRDVEKAEGCRVCSAGRRSELQAYNSMPGMEAI